MPRGGRRIFRAQVFNLCNSDERKEYEEIMQSINDDDGRFELADDKKSNWDKAGNYNVALEFFEFEGS